ncbi:hypothetical protein ACLOJK_004060 [Asimina triloba]
MERRDSDLSCATWSSPLNPHTPQKKRVLQNLLCFVCVLSWSPALSAAKEKQQRQAMLCCRHVSVLQSSCKLLSSYSPIFSPPRLLSSTSSLPFPSSLISLFSPKRCLAFYGIRNRAYGASACASVLQERKDDEAAGESFFVDESVTWKSLGISDHLSRALSDAGLHRPSKVQCFFSGCYRVQKDTDSSDPLDTFCCRKAQLATLRYEDHLQIVAQ